MSPRINYQGLRNHQSAGCLSSTTFTIQRLLFRYARRGSNSMSSHVLLRGGHREHPAGSVLIGEPDPNEIVQITLILKRCNSAPDPKASDGHLTQQELADRHGADPADIEAV